MQKVLAALIIATVALSGVTVASGSLGRPSIDKGKVEVLCWNKDFPNQGPPQIRSKPHKCQFFRRGVDYLAGAVYFRTNGWNHWGARHTSAGGEYFEPMAPDPWIPVDVKLVKPVEHCGRTVYSKAIFNFHGRKSSFRLWTC